MKNIKREQVAVMNIQYKYFPLALSLEITDGRYFMNPSASVGQSIEKLFSAIYQYVFSAVI